LLANLHAVPKTLAVKLDVRITFDNSGLSKVNGCLIGLFLLSLAITSIALAATSAGENPG
jgi:hypothetical protein